MGWSMDAKERRGPGIIANAARMAAGRHRRTSEKLPVTNFEPPAPCPGIGTSTAVRPPVTRSAVEPLIVELPLPPKSVDQITPLTSVYTTDLGCVADELMAYTLAPVNR